MLIISPKWAEPVCACVDIMWKSVLFVEMNRCYCGHKGLFILLNTDVYTVSALQPSHTSHTAHFQSCEIRWRTKLLMVIIQWCMRMFSVFLFCSKGGKNYPLPVYGWPRAGIILLILLLWSKKKDGYTALEKHQCQWAMSSFSFLVEVTL